MESIVLVDENVDGKNNEIVAQEKIQKIIELLNSDPSKLCYECEAMKYYGALYPICEPVLTLLKEILEEDDAE